MSLIVSKINCELNMFDGDQSPRVSVSVFCVMPL